MKAVHWRTTRLTTACSGRANKLVFYHQRPVRAADAGRWALSPGFYVKIKSVISHFRGFLKEGDNGTKSPHRQMFVLRKAIHAL